MAAHKTLCALLLLGTALSQSYVESFSFYYFGGSVYADADGFTEVQFKNPTHSWITESPGTYTDGQTLYQYMDCWDDDASDANAMFYHANLQGTYNATTHEVEPDISVTAIYSLNFNDNSVQVDLSTAGVTLTHVSGDVYTLNFGEDKTGSLDTSFGSGDIAQINVACDYLPWTSTDLTSAISMNYRAGLPVTYDDFKKFGIINDFKHEYLLSFDDSGQDLLVDGEYSTNHVVVYDNSDVTIDGSQVLRFHFAEGISNPSPNNMGDIEMTADNKDNWFVANIIRISAGTYSSGTGEFVFERDLPFEIVLSSNAWSTKGYLIRFEEELFGGDWFNHADVKELANEFVMGSCYYLDPVIAGSDYSTLYDVCLDTGEQISTITIDESIPGLDADSSGSTQLACFQMNSEDFYPSQGDSGFRIKSLGDGAGSLSTTPGDTFFEYVEATDDAGKFTPNPFKVEPMTPPTSVDVSGPIEIKFNLRDKGLNFVNGGDLKCFWQTAISGGVLSNDLAAFQTPMIEEVGAEPIPRMTFPFQNWATKRPISCDRKDNAASYGLLTALGAALAFLF